MIKVGIYGSASLDDPVRKQLLRLLLRHPDVELMAVAAPSGNTAPFCGWFRTSNPSCWATPTT